MLLRLLNDEIFVRHHLERIQIAHFLGLQIAEIAEALYRVRIICGEREQARHFSFS